MHFTRNRLIVLASLFALVLAAGIFVACGGDSGGTTTATPTAAATTPAGGSPTVTASGGAVEACPPSGAATALTGAGATFPAPLYEDWFARYKDLCGVEVNYQAIGSGGGITQITAKTVDFGASDGIMNADQKAAADPIHHIPMTSDAVAVVYNLEGIDSGAITLDSTTLANIFLGTITKWNDPAIAALNSGVTLPSEDIAVVHRSDGSGTTFIFTNYLSKVSSDWQSQVGNATSVQWPTGTGAEGNAGVAGQVQQLPNSIGYVSLAYAVQNNIDFAKMKNKSGNAIEPSIDSARAAQKGITLPDNMEVMLTDSSDADAYPITGFTWLLVYVEQSDKAKAETLAHMIHWMLTDAQQYAEGDSYVPLSDTAVEKAMAELADTTFQGTPILELK
ncbi:MAG TPA: phosphate ABC transporter substrate-binding protein PstS [Dehalococcoidia bacterium]|nr:phosphate ABC transporter substrate-binding protein PstS [Dehalococcoidia bacterium]